MDIEEFKDLTDIPDDDDEEEKVGKGPRPALEDPRSLYKYTIPTYPIFIGRDRKCAICIAIPAVSRKHAKVYEQDGKFYIQDLGSINGTFVNDKRILDPAEIKEGDKIKVGVTQKYPRGAKELVFRSNAEERSKLEKEKRKERDALLQEAGVVLASSTEAKKVLLRHCIFKISRQNIVSMFKEELKRVPLVNLDMTKKMVYFQSLIPYKVKDILVLNVEHPRFGEPLRITLRLLSCQSINSPDYGVIEHKGLITKISEKHKSLMDSMMEPSDLICYISSTIKPPASLVTSKEN